MSFFILNVFPFSIGDLELVKKVVLDHPHIVNCRDLDGRHSTPLHFAAGYNRVGVVEFLLQHGKSFIIFVY